MIAHDSCRVHAIQARCLDTISAVHLLYEDRAGNLWVATEADGLFVVGANATRHLTVADGLPSDWVISIHEDERGVVWLGTTDGLAVWRDNKLISLVRFGGPMRETILQVLEDASHQIWFTTNKGLMSVPRADLDALAGGGENASPRLSHLRCRRRPAHTRIRRRQHLRGMRIARRHALVSERARHRARRSRPHSDQQATARPCTSRKWRSTTRRSRSPTASNRPRCAPMGIRLHRPESAGSATLALSLSARGLRRRLGRCGQSPHGVLHPARAGHLYIQGHREQQRRRVERARERAFDSRSSRICIKPPGSGRSAS